MKLTFDEKAVLKVNAIKDSNDVLVLNMDDGVGEFSHILTENGLKYNLLIVKSNLLQKYSYGHFDSSLGKVYFDKDTELFLDDEMQIRFNPRTATYQLVSTNALLEPNLPIIRKTPNFENLMQ